MPIYEYAPESGGCEKCSGHFEVLQSMGAEPLTCCPDCGQPCHRVLSAVSHQVGKAHLLTPKNLESKGFTQYRKAGDGFYEKTAGTEGPDVIHRG
ncbi:MAG: zinc ribbon domain-containing protein [Planctomycetaceae bacterium]|nr:MAG: zinc ribbon domain-containing protein [Planctomycetaceae bacterium]